MKFANWRVCLFLACGPCVVQAVEPPPSSLQVKEESAIEIPERRSSEQSAGSRETSIPSKVNRYAKYLLTKYDHNRDGVLQKDEWKAMHGHPELIDFEGTGVITLDELTQWIADYGQRKRIGVPHELEAEAGHTSQTKPASSKDEDSATNPANPNSTAGDRRRDQKFFVPSNRLPWFLARDQDGDGQLTVGEFSPTGTAADLAEFNTYDANGDGVITAKECVHKGAEKTATTTKDTNDPRMSSPDQSSKKQPRKRRTQKPAP